MPYTQPLAVDPSERFVFAAGQDKVIRAWSVSSGQLLRDPELLTTVTGTRNPVRLFNTAFKEGISGIQLVEDHSGLHLWYSTGSALYDQMIL
jgi:DDB1- and CUL4-associated factor 4